MTRPEPVDLDSLIFVSVDGVRCIGVPNDRERQLADRLLLDRGMWGYGTHSLATVLAAVREGSTLPGQRGRARVVLHIARYALDGPDRDVVIAQATRSLWRRWIDELTQHGQRPVGWPAVQRTYLAWITYPGPPDEPDPDAPAGMHAVHEGAMWDVLQLRIVSETVPT